MVTKAQLEKQLCTEEGLMIDCLSLSRKARIQRIFKLDKSTGALVWKVYGKTNMAFRRTSKEHGIDSPNKIINFLIDRDVILLEGATA